MKDMLSRVSVPGRVFDLLWTDDEFFRDITGSKKVTSSGKFPRCDQWCDEKGFHMAFALAGYSASDVCLTIEGNVLSLTGVGNKLDESSLDNANGKPDEYPAKTPSPGVQQGIIVRGIARRNFKTKYFIHPSFNLSMATASMKDGLLEFFVPRGEATKPVEINIKEK